jgi:hypothetical protein
VRFKALLAVSMKIRAFWGVAPCSLVGAVPPLRGSYFFTKQGYDGGSTHL